MQVVFFGGARPSHDPPSICWQDTPVVKSQIACRGSIEGSGDGFSDGLMLGTPVGEADGLIDGDTDGPFEGILVGRADGPNEGEEGGQ